MRDDYIETWEFGDGIDLKQLGHRVTNYQKFIPLYVLFCSKKVQVEELQSFTKNNFLEIFQSLSKSLTNDFFLIYLNRKSLEIEYEKNKNSETLAELWKIGQQYLLLQYKSLATIVKQLKNDRIAQILLKTVCENFEKLDVKNLNLVNIVSNLLENYRYWIELTHVFVKNTFLFEEDYPRFLAKFTDLFAENPSTAVMYIAMEIEKYFTRRYRLEIYNSQHGFQQFLFDYCKNSFLTSVSFVNIPITDNNFSKSSEILRETKYLKELIFLRCTFDVGGMKTIQTLLSQNLGIEALEFKYCELKENLTEIAAILRSTTSLKSLKIIDVHLLLPEIRCLLDSLTNNQSLTELSLRKIGAPFNEDEALLLLKIMRKNFFLKTLDLSHCLSPNGLEELLLGLDTFSVETLNFKGNSFTPIAELYLMAILNTNIVLTNLNLNFCDLSEDGAINIIDSLKTNHKIKCLKLAYNKLTDTVLEHVGEMLMENYGLEYLDISGNNFSAEAIAKFLNILTTNKTLTQLKFIPLTLSQVKPLLLSNTSLQKLQLKRLDKIDDLYEILSKNCTLRLLDFEAGLTISTTSLLIETLAANTSFCKFLKRSFLDQVGSILDRNFELNTLITPKASLLPKKHSQTDPAFWKVEKLSRFGSGRLSFPGANYDVFCDNLRCFVGILLKAYKFKALDRKLSNNVINGDNSAIVFSSILQIIEIVILENFVNDLLMFNNAMLNIKNVYATEPNLVLFTFKKIENTCRTIESSYDFANRDVFFQQKKLGNLFDFKMVKLVIKNIHNILSLLVEIKEACISENTTNSNALKTSDMIRPML